MGKRTFHWDPIDDCVMMETDENLDTIVTYTHEPGQFGPLLSENRSGTEFYHHYDALGSTTMLTNDTGDVTDTFQYDAWGDQLARTGTTPTPYQWVGRWGYQSDSITSVAYIRARVYQFLTARWSSFDPIGLTDREWNLLRYARNSPVVLIDPSGNLAQCCCCCVDHFQLAGDSDWEDRTYMGNRFNVKMWLSYKIKFVKNNDCTFEWNENNSNPGRKNGLPLANKWTDMLTFEPKNDIFKPWFGRETPCPGSESLKFTDPPAITKRINGLAANTNTRVLKFKLTVSSGLDCTCPTASITIRLQQVLVVDLGVPDWKASSFTVQDSGY